MLMRPIGEILLRMHQQRPIDGDVLFIGRQAFTMGPEATAEIMRAHGVNPRSLSGGTTNVGGPGTGWVDDFSFMGALGCRSFKTLDITDFSADFIHDMGVPIPDELKNRFDFIYNGGCFDNMFNPGIAMMNISKMLRPGGRTLDAECADPMPGAYLMYSPAWFADFYEANNYQTWSTYIARIPFGPYLYWGPYDLQPFDFKADPSGSAPMSEPRYHHLIVAHAEKRMDGSSTDEVQPIQLQYRLPHQDKLDS